MSAGRPRSPWRGERGSVAAEFAVAMPAVLLVLVLAIGLLAAAAHIVTLQDAAADAARLAARGESESRALEPLTRVGASGRIELQGDAVCVLASAPAPLPFMAPLGASSCALAGGL